MPGSIKDRVAIVGMGCTRFGELWDKGPSDLIVDAVTEAYADAGVEAKDIEAVWGGSIFSGHGGRSISEPLRMQYVPITHVVNACASGHDAVRNAAYSVAAGIYDLVLAVGFEKLKDEGMSGLPGMDNRTHTHAVATMPGMFAMMATKYFHRYGLSPEEGKTMLAKISVKSHANGSLNPKAHLRNVLTIERVLNAPIIAWPLGLFDCCSVSDGGAAAIITSADKAKEFRRDPVYIKALQLCTSPTSGRLTSEYDYTHVEEGYRAGVAAYKEAGITDPRKEISMAEVHDCFSITEAVTMEDLQFSPRGKVKDDIDAGTFELSGELPVQPDGGLKCFGHPIGASGIRMLYELYLQLQGRADKRQIKDPKLGLAHNMGHEPFAPTVSVCIVGL
ncbi:MAG: acetyl-CoA acetyltransferase [Dehalococcoidia bacterium]|nr:MAG: acetyl-CoA acetyltransferase [Dehalococcoidia bacterium]